MPKQYDLAVKTGQYETQAGTKNRYSNIGAVMDGNDGGMYAVLDPHILLGLCHAAISKGQDRLMVSMFQPRQDGQRSQATAATQQRPAQRQAAASDTQGGGFDDDIPFGPLRRLEGM